MKRVTICALLLINTAATWAILVAQERASRHYPHYRVIDTGTLGGPQQSYRTGRAPA
jgi:hypothetical protein